jgi:hypothetical protein
MTVIDPGGPTSAAARFLAPVFAAGAFVAGAWIGSAGTCAVGLQLLISSASFRRSRRAAGSFVMDYDITAASAR